MRDLKALPSDLRMEISKLGGEDLTRHMDALLLDRGGRTAADVLDKAFTPFDSKLEIRRLSTFGDVEGKTR